MGQVIEIETARRRPPGPAAPAFSAVPELLEELRRGRMIVVMDDEDRENEGDLVMAAEHATAAAINFMITHARGLVCLALDSAASRRLGLRMMTEANGSAFGTAFTVSIEARQGVKTGISAPDRARTVAAAIDPASGPGDVVSPGHVFPLVAQDDGVLARAGHTEAAVDYARLAGLTPAGVICEVLRPDGEMARLPDLVAFAATHGLKLGSIADLAAYRRIAPDGEAERAGPGLRELG